MCVTDFELAAIVVLKAEKLWWIYVLGRLRLYSNIAHEIFICLSALINLINSLLIFVV